MVEIDVQLTKDGEVVVYHDAAREVNEATPTLGGLMIVELKATSPLCDPRRHAGARHRRRR